MKEVRGSLNEDRGGDEALEMFKGMTERGEG